MFPSRTSPSSLFLMGWQVLWPCLAWSVLGPGPRVCQQVLQAGSVQPPPQLSSHKSQASSVISAHHHPSSSYSPVGAAVPQRQVHKSAIEFAHQICFSHNLMGAAAQPDVAPTFTGGYGGLAQPGRSPKTPAFVCTSRQRLMLFSLTQVSHVDR